MKPALYRVLRGLARFAGLAAAAAVVLSPITLERAIEHASFEDRVGTFPVDVSLARNGVTTLDTGILGKVYWEQTGTFGFGASVESTGPPLADGTLSSYVSPSFLRANSEFVDDPDRVARLYGDELVRQVTRRWLTYELVAGLAGGALLVGLLRDANLPVPSRLRRRQWTRISATACYVLAGTVVSASVAVIQMSHWEGTEPPGSSYVMPGRPELSFSSRQTLEVARQIQPFVEKNSARITARTRAYLDAAEASIDAVLPQHGAGLQRRDGEQVVIAEADPQGSTVATRVRRYLYARLGDLLGEDAIALRTISGDVTSNGTIAERDFVRREAEASPDVPTVAVKGDHDTETTVEQLRDHGLEAPDLETLDVGGLHVAGAADPAFKALFGGLVENPSGVTEEEVGRRLRDVVDEDQPVIVLVHQPRAALGYLGIETISTLTTAIGQETTPYDDGIPDLPPGIVNIGHLHDAAGPWVIWNTDEDEVTWTVVNQLGTSGGVEENPTFNRFSTPFSVPLKDVSVRLEYVNPDTGLQTGYASIRIAPSGAVSVEDRVDIGLPGGEPAEVDSPRVPSAADQFAD